MTKQLYLETLEERLLSFIPERIAPSDARRCLESCGKMIESRIREGMTEEEAVAAAGDPETRLRAFFGDLPALIRPPLYRPMVPAPEKKKTSPWIVALLAVTSPVWISLLIAAAAVVGSLYVVLWSVVFSVWAVFISLAGGGALVLACSVPLIFSGSLTEGLAAVGAGLAALGLALVFLVLSLAVTRLAARLTASSFRGICRLFSRKERVK